MRAFLCIGVIGLLAGVAFSQAAEAPSAFDIADVHVSAKALTPSMRGPVFRGDRYEIRNATMVDLIRTAYGMDADKVLSGPSWLESDRFDVAAKTRPNTPPDAVKLMLQALLADRFKLVLHKDMKDLPGYALTAGKKPLLKETDGAPETGCKYTIEGLPQPGNAQGGPTPIALPPSLNFLYTCHNMTMTAFAEGMRTMVVAQTFFANAQVVDRTGLKGAWDFTLKYSLPTARLLQGLGQGTQGGDDSITIFTAVDKQLGLKLDPMKISTPVLIVDSVNQTPTANPPGITTSLPPPPPTEFEVADIKPSAPGAPGRGGGIQPGGRLDLRGGTLKSFITLGWEIPSDDFLVGAPKFLDVNHYDLVAKAPSFSSTSVPAGAPGPVQAIDIDALRLMIRSLLADRFKLVTHYEDRPVPAYALVATKPKLQKADPTNRTGCKEGPGPDGKDPRIGNPALSRLFTCLNMTMAQFADQIPRISGGSIRTTVVDTTGLEGAWDFTLSFSAPNLVLINGGGGGRSGELGPPPPPPPPGGGNAASDPNGAVSFEDALNKQLGIKLEMQKRPMPVLVIDHVEEKPTDN